MLEIIDEACSELVFDVVYGNSKTNESGKRKIQLKFKARCIAGEGRVGAFVHTRNVPFPSLSRCSIGAIYRGEARFFRLSLGFSPITSSRCTPRPFISNFAKPPTPAPPCFAPTATTKL